MKLVHGILTFAFKGMARLPLWLLYVISDVMFVLLYHCLRYRRKVVETNLRESFPDQDKKWLLKTRRRFYRNFSDYIVETIKLLHISDDEMRRRMQFVNTEIIDSLVKEGRSVVVYFSHCFNWEWAPSVTLWFNHNAPCVAAQVYRPLKDQWFDGVMLKIRGRFGSESFAKSHVLRDLLMLRREGIPSVTGFMSDQKPSHGDPTDVVMFLNHPTAMITGTETLARRLDMATVYWDIEKLSRGHYRITTRLISSDLSDSEPYAVTDRYARLLEATIRRDPSIWLWTHKRWKNPVTMPKNEQS